MKFYLFIKRDKNIYIFFLTEFIFYLLYIYINFINIYKYLCEMYI